MQRKRELVALWLSVLCVMPGVGLQAVIVAFPGHTQFLITTLLNYLIL